MSDKLLSELNSIDDVANYLGIPKQQLVYLLYVTDEAMRYKISTIPKKRGGQREIQSPRDELKFLQHCLAEKLYEIYKPRNTTHGFCIGKSIVTNAKAHFRARYIFNVDLKNFFPSINFGRVRGMFLKKPYKVPPKAATVLAQICCHQNTLPQGAPTSPIISNMICSRLDGQLLKLAKQFNCMYTRYVDDITFSKRDGMFPPEIGRKDGVSVFVGDELRKVITDNGFAINSDKIHLHSNRERQRVTGLIVNEKVNVPRGYVRQIRSMIYAWYKFGEKEAEREHATKYYRRTGKTGVVPPFQRILWGKMEYLKMVKGPQDSVYKNLQSQLVAVWPEYQEVMNLENSKLLYRDVFVSHAREDKDSFVRSLAEALVKSGISVWYDEYEIKWGDSIQDKINGGLANSKYGIVILSKGFFLKPWPQQELKALLSQYMIDGKTRILPILHNITIQDVLKKVPLVSDIAFLDSSEDALPDIVLKFKDKLRD